MKINICQEQTLKEDTFVRMKFQRGHIYQEKILKADTFVGNILEEGTFIGKKYKKMTHLSEKKKIRKGTHLS